MSKVKFESNIGAVSKAISGSTKRAVKLCCIDLIQKTIPRTPLLTGDLRGSLNARYEETPDTFIGRVGSALPYAVTVHEDLSRNFREPGTGAKFLENTAIENRKKYEGIIASTLRTGVVSE